MKSKTPIAVLSAVLSVAAARAEIAPDETLMEVTWFENAVTESKAGWSGYGLVYANEKYTLDVERAVSFTPVAQTGKAVRQVFDIDLRPVDRLPEVDAGAQTAFVVRAADAGQSVVAWGRSAPDAAAAWHELGAPVYGKRLAVEIDYAAGADAPAAVRYYLTDDAGDTPFGGTLYSANAQTQVTQYDFTGSGTLTSLTGTQTAETAAIVDGVKYAAADVTDDRLIAALTRGAAVKVFDRSLVPDGYAVNDSGELHFIDDPTAPQDGLLYYFPLEGTVANVGGSRGGKYVSVGEELIWDDNGWTGSPFGERSLCSASAETKVCNEDGIVPEGSRWTISFWVNTSREDWGWKDACGFRIGDQVYNFERIDGAALQLYGKPGDYLHWDDGWDKPIECGADWVNVSVVCGAALDAVDVYVNGAYHASIAVEQADNLTGFYFSAHGLREPAAPSQMFVDEVSIWGRALGDAQLAYLARFPAQERILTDGPLFAAKAGDTWCDTVQEALALGGTVTLLADATVDETLVIDGAVTLDLGAFTLSASAELPDGAAVLEVTAGGSLTLASGTIIGRDCAIRAGSGALTITGGTVRGDAHAVVLQREADTTLSVAITGGTFESSGAPVVSLASDAGNAPAPDGFISGGSFKGETMPDDLIRAEGDYLVAWSDPDEAGYVTVSMTAAAQDGLLYYFPLEGRVANVGGTRRGKYVSVGDELTWDDDGWTGSPFGERSLRCSSAETKVCNEDGIVPEGSRWTISFWVNASREEGEWKDVCGFRIGEQIYNFELTDAKALQLYGRSGDYLHGDDDATEKPIACGDDWVNVSLVCTAARDAVEVYVNGAYHATIAVAQADNLTGFYFSAYSLREEPVPSMVFVDEVSIWGRGLDSSQLAYLAEAPATERILIDDFWFPPEGEMLYYFPLEGTVENVGGTRGMRDVTVGEGLAWAHDDGWTGSPFGERSLRCTSDETKVCNADGLVAAGSRWTVSFWLNLSCEAWDWKNACGFRIGEQIYNFRKGSGSELHLYGGPGDYLHLENDTDEKPIVCGADWVNVSLVCRTALDGVDVYVNGTYHASLFVADADRLTGFYFTENGLSDEGRKYSCVFIDEVSIWSCALDADQLAYLAAHPAMEEILYVKKGWARVTERTRFAEVPGLTPAQARSLSATGVVALRLARWAVAHDVPYGAEIDVAAFAMNCDPSDKATEAAKLRLTIEMDGEEPIVGVLTDADGEPVTKDWNIQPTIKGKVRLSDETWGDRYAEGVRFFKAFIDL